MAIVVGMRVIGLKKLYLLWVRLSYIHWGE